MWSYANGSISTKKPYVAVVFNLFVLVEIAIKFEQKCLVFFT